MRDLSWLRSTLAAIDRIYFFDALSDAGVTIKWMRYRRNKTQVRLGCYRFRTLVIEINPILAHEWVPDFCLMGTIFHEALHFTFGAVHSKEFYVSERRYPHFVDDEMWQKANFERLLAARPPIGVK